MAKRPGFPMGGGRGGSMQSMMEQARNFPNGATIMRIFSFSITVISFSVVCIRMLGSMVSIVLKDASFASIRAGARDKLRQIPAIRTLK